MLAIENLNGCMGEIKGTAGEEIKKKLSDKDNGGANSNTTNNESKEKETK